MRAYSPLEMDDLPFCYICTLTVLSRGKKEKEAQNTLIHVIVSELIAMKQMCKYVEKHRGGISQNLFRQ